MPPRKPYKEPVFLFTSGSLRFAAWAGWHSARGEAKMAEQWAHQASGEWIKELNAGRGYDFLGRYNHDLYSYLEPAQLKKLLDDFLKILKREIKKSKAQKLR